MDNLLRPLKGEPGKPHPNPSPSTGGEGTQRTERRSSPDEEFIVLLLKEKDKRIRSLNKEQKVQACDATMML